MHKTWLIYLSGFLLLCGLVGALVFWRTPAGGGAYRLDETNDREWFSLTKEHIGLLRQMQVAWSPVESGAPLISLDRKHLASDGDYAKIGFAVEIFLQKARLAPGTYSYANPHYEDRKMFEKRLQDLSDGWANWREIYPTQKIVRFALAPEHIKLIKHASMRVNPGWSGGPVAVINEKRPYGDFTYFEADMAKILGYPTGIDAKKHVTMPNQQEQKLFNLHLQTMKAVQVFLLNAELSPGRYTRSPAGYGPWR